jgi:hypothetical protein
LALCCATREERRREQHANVTSAHHAPNDNKMSDGGRGRASLGVEVSKSS